MPNIHRTREAPIEPTELRIVPGATKMPVPIIWLKLRATTVNGPTWRPRGDTDSLFPSASGSWVFLPSTIPLTKGVDSVVKIGDFEMEFFEDDDAADAEEAPESLLVSMPSIIDILE